VHLATSRQVFYGGIGPTIPKVSNGLAVLFIVLSLNGIQVGCTHALLNSAKRGAGIYGLELPRISHEYNLGAGSLSVLQERGSLSATTHASLVHHQDIAVVRGSLGE